MAISDRDRKILWGRSGNRCAFPNCPASLIKVVSPEREDLISVIGEECHIVAEEEEGPRGKSKLTKKERNKYDNLILLCRSHHKEIDDHDTYYTVEKLKAFKARHEEEISNSEAGKSKFIFTKTSMRYLYASILLITYLYILIVTVESKGITPLEMLCILVFNIVVATVYFLLVKSNNKFKEVYENYYAPQLNTYKSNSKYPIEVVINDKGISNSRGDRVLQRNILIKNNANKIIDKIVGQVIFYNNNIRMRTVEFEKSKIKSEKIEIIDETVFSNISGEWDEVEIDILEIEYGSIIQKNLQLSGIKLIRTYYFVLNYFNYWTIFGRTIPYEVTWLREETRGLWSWFKFVPVIYSKNSKRHVYPYTLYKRILQIIIIFLIISILVATTLGFFVLIKIILMIFNLV
ncbi:HNH endonuclease signature motif containing protein [Paenibacillus sp. S-38]|uniref:HNH endonuclease signature motif containing protein n=1 Tax=Paenibacillus sp. S-38 TaxID=3416710 RepID=UPI003CFB089B